MLDLNAEYQFCWDENLRPIGESTIEKESFELWWGRHNGHLSNLDPKIAEQWVFRHWKYSPCAFIPLETLTWTEEVWTTDEVISLIHREWGGTFSPDFDYSAFHQKGFTHPTARALDAGTWDYPIVVLYTPNGVQGIKGKFPQVRFALVEGHQRTRYLNALKERGVSNGPHKVFVLRSPITGSNMS